MTLKEGLTFLISILKVNQTCTCIENEFNFFLNIFFYQKISFLYSFLFLMVNVDVLVSSSSSSSLLCRCPQKMNSNQTNKRYQRSQVNRRASESCLEEIERAYRLDPEQIILRKFPHHKIGFPLFYFCVLVCDVYNKISNLKKKNQDSPALSEFKGIAHLYEELLKSVDKSQKYSLVFLFDKKLDLKKLLKK